ncbi:caspase family protein [Sutcliffiella cohnii]|uniref:caspase family protein n=1 Tax=Sutcliffiella cohnii TaxID=33932 RepID=UPI002E23F4AA|nr:caspase family protein [Sutcliffiella cohnii]
MRKALVVGLDNYPSAPLYGCVNDAVRMEQVLQKNGDGSPNFSVRTILGSATKRDLRESIESLFHGENDVALLYFSGHGLIKSSGGYIVTTDFERYDEGISMDEILTYANQSRARDKIIIFDCCHSGSFGSPNIGNGNLAQLSDGLTILTASRSDEVSMEVNGAGIFTSLIIDALQGGAADLRGFVTPGSLYSYVDEALGAWDQRPVFKTNVSRFTHLRRIDPPIPLATLRNLAEYFTSPEEEFQLDPSYEFTSESPIEEHVEIFKDLQKFQSVGLVVPVDADYMYFAAMESKSCRLTALGFQYWRLVKEGNL